LQASPFASLWSSLAAERGFPSQGLSPTTFKYPLCRFPAMNPDARRWWERAQEDLAVAAHDLAGGFERAAAFHAQQAAEKALKALLVHRGIVPPKVHDLMELATRSGAPADVRERCKALSPAYLEARYPDVPSSVGPAAPLVQQAREVMAWVESQMK